MIRNAKFLRGADSESNSKNYAQGLKYELDTSWTVFDPQLTFFNPTSVIVTDKQFRYAYIDKDKIIFNANLDIKVVSGGWSFFRFETPFKPKQAVCLNTFSIIYGVAVYPDSYCYNFQGMIFRNQGIESTFEAGTGGVQSNTTNTLNFRMNGIIEVERLI